MAGMSPYPPGCRVETRCLLRPQRVLQHLAQIRRRQDGCVQRPPTQVLGRLLGVLLGTYPRWGVLPEGRHQAAVMQSTHRRRQRWGPPSRG